ncbi:MutS-related protein [Clostridium saccharoperbutylacetonicum]|uniref:MutS-related protein n=1 Tax=Clostridium saccharoperbutylacetonicum TaxID=36745 RepID=UPI000983C197|nr:MutS family DNA mismatch repair protein [Clostridium saccharoperbutylacetonicum]AQR97668.1 DNA mismatch repair protein MutS [Clostridium saccharoperbutylacetonicum]NSB33554.1 DNA mismatch repair ATPase MutS [Clostridium saccharoperbutylacetonicum]
MVLAEEFYENNIKKNRKESQELNVKVSIVGWSRLVVVILAVVIDYILYTQNSLKTIILVTIIFSIIFLALVFYHNNIFECKKKLDLLVEINEEGIKRLNGEFKYFKDNGEEYLDNKHSFINDLDIFGNNSVFQYINSTVTKGGREELSKVLKKEKILVVQEIRERQEAIKELGEKVSWRQKLIVEGKLKRSKDIDLNGLLKWSKVSESSSYLRIAIACTFIFVTLCSIYLIAVQKIPAAFLLLDLMVNYLVIKIMSKGIKEEIKLFENTKCAIYSYSRILELIENENFNSIYLKRLQDKLRSETTSCTEEMKKFSKIVDWAGNSSYNAYYLLFNVIIFLDVFLMSSLEKWREKNGDKLDIWLDVMHEIDALSSISNLSFENDKWIYPVILDTDGVEGAVIGHPLLGKRAVKNSFSLIDNRRVALITGSNMSGKSTFLRTIGVNLILSYIGAPVCAEKFSCGIMNVYTCMRTKDNLEESISSFYAEILRIKILIEACKKGEKIFFLLDEIFKGTNSKDRHTGATVLIKQLIQYGGFGLVSTHDLELCDLENEDRRIVNYNFREFYEKNKIKFDYILRRGKSETQNAIQLMKLAGIEIEK